MNIAHILSNPIVGGTETLVVQLARAQAQLGDACEILNLWRGSDVSGLAASAGVPYAETKGFASRFISPGALAECMGWLAQKRIDVVCAHGFRVQMALRLASRLLRRRPCLVGVLHGVETWRQRWHVWPDRMTSDWMDGYVGISAEVCAVWQAREAIPPVCMRCIPNGVDFGFFCREAAAWPPRVSLGLPASGGLVLTVANYRSEKGHDFLIEMLSGHAHLWPDLHFCWCGKGEDEARLRAVVAAHGLAGRVHFLGHIPDVRPLLAHAELFLLPSREEGLPLALLEAMSMGAACVATDVGGVGGALRDGQDGTLIRFGDVGACAQAVERYHVDRSLRERHGASARMRIVSEYGIDRAARRYSDYFRELLASQGDHPVST